MSLEVIGIMVCLFFAANMITNISHWIVDWRVVGRNYKIYIAETKELRKCIEVYKEKEREYIAALLEKSPAFRFDVTGIHLMKAEKEVPKSP